MQCRNLSTLHTVGSFEDNFYHLWNNEQVSVHFLLRIIQGSCKQNVKHKSH